MTTVLLGVAANDNTKLIKLNRSGIVNCDCKHGFQDERYGKGKRVATPVNSQQKSGAFVVACTVCGRTHNLGKV